VTTHKTTGDFWHALKGWSERRDLNSGPLAPHASALPDCATLRHNFFISMGPALGTGAAGGMILAFAAGVRPLAGTALVLSARLEHLH
jgi:hypothetical protein